MNGRELCVCVDIHTRVMSFFTDIITVARNVYGLADKCAAG